MVVDWLKGIILTKSSLGISQSMNADHAESGPPLTSKNQENEDADALWHMKK
jgi:hypothetical protein